MKLTIISDLHGNQKHHLQLIHSFENTLQLGDLGFSYQYLEDAKVDYSRHRFFGGNHDNYDVIEQSPYALGDYGVMPGFSDAFFIRGADSIDKGMRTVGVDWWAREQMTMEELTQCIDSFDTLNPPVVVSHTCPQFLVPHLVPPNSPHPKQTTRTSMAMNEMFELHEPDLWVFGHWHTSFTKRVGATTFICLGKCQTLTIDF